ncbi:hypothetical protein B2G71_19505 [Novosphingobium sp. PC22D]|nr:hypothetical protein B2G71_19505 [Novosphingobium sp. PC22D]
MLLWEETEDFGKPSIRECHEQAAKDYRFSGGNRKIHKFLKPLTKVFELISLVGMQPEENLDITIKGCSKT